MDCKTDHDVATGIRRLVLDHGFTQFFMASAPAAGQIVNEQPAIAVGGGAYFEIYLEGRRYVVHVSRCPDAVRT